MKKLIARVAIIMLFLTVNVSTVYATYDPDSEQARINLYKIEGMAGVWSRICDGEWTPEEAYAMCIKPAYEAGCVEQKPLDFICNEYPVIKDLCIADGIPVGDITPAQNPTPKPTPDTEKYVIEDCDMYKYATTQVNVRSDASTNADKVGSVEQNAQVHITGKTTNGWYRLEYNGITGFSVQKYFADKPIETIEGITDVPEPTTAPTPEPTQEPVATAEPTAEPTATPESDTRTEIVKPIEEPTPVPQVTEAPNNEAESTPAPTTAPVTPQEEEVPVPVIVAGSVIGLIIMVGIVVAISKTVRKRNL